MERPIVRCAFHLLIGSHPNRRKRALHARSRFPVAHCFLPIISYALTLSIVNYPFPPPSALHQSLQRPTRLISDHPVVNRRSTQPQAQCPSITRTSTASMPAARMACMPRSVSS
jgi:hypothetical protein